MSVVSGAVETAIPAVERTTRPLAYRRRWLAAVLVAKAADVATTLVGLMVVGGASEGAPVPAAVIDAVGVVPGIVALSVVAVALLPACSVLMGWLWGDRPCTRVGACAVYGLVGGFWLLAAAHNTVLIGSLIA